MNETIETVAQAEDITAVAQELAEAIRAEHAASETARTANQVALDANNALVNAQTKRLNVEQRYRYAALGVSPTEFFRAWASGGQIIGMTGSDGKPGLDCQRATGK